MGTPFSFGGHFLMRLQGKDSVKPPYHEGGGWQFEQINELAQNETELSNSQLGWKLIVSYARKAAEAWNIDLNNITTNTSLIDDPFIPSNETFVSLVSVAMANFDRMENNKVSC
uniref:Uncharacterized protein n=1 Tax=Parascaris equorum TaxID=6256 RepID=A0A914R3K4_PAREQ